MSEPSNTDNSNSKVYQAFESTELTFPNQLYATEKEFLTAAIVAAFEDENLLKKISNYLRNTKLSQKALKYINYKIKEVQNFHKGLFKDDFSVFSLTDNYISEGIKTELLRGVKRMETFDNPKENILNSEQLQREVEKRLWEIPHPSSRGFFVQNYTPVIRLGAPFINSNVLEISPWVKSFSYFLGMPEKKAFDFVFCPKLFTIGIRLSTKSGQGHDSIIDALRLKESLGNSNSLDENENTVSQQHLVKKYPEKWRNLSDFYGGRICRLGNYIFTNEWSGHYGENWGVSSRYLFIELIKQFFVGHIPINLIHYPGILGDSDLFAGLEGGKIVPDKLEFWEKKQLYFYRTVGVNSPANNIISNGLSVMFEYQVNLTFVFYYISESEKERFLKTKYLEIETQMLSVEKRKYFALQYSKKLTGVADGIRIECDGDLVELMKPETPEFIGEKQEEVLKKEISRMKNLAALGTSAQAYKEQGNNQYRQKNFGYAYKCYMKVLQLYKYVEANREVFINQNSKELENLKKTVVEASNNIAMIFINYGDYDKALTMTTFDEKTDNSFSLHPDAKSFYLRGKIFMIHKKLVAAVDCFKKGLELNPQNKELEKKIDECEEKKQMLKNSLQTSLLSDWEEEDILQPYFHTNN